MYSVFVCTILTISSVTGNSLIQPVLNPGCTGCSANETVLVYVKAQDDMFDYVIHQVWDFTGRVPSMLYIMGNVNSTLKIEWDGSKPTQILTNGSFYSFAIILNNLIEYNDVKGRVYFDYKDPYREISLRDVTWRLEDSDLTKFEAKVRVRGALSWGRHGMNGTIDMKLLLVPFVGRSRFLPRLYHSVNSTQADVGLVDLSTTPEYAAARFALRYVVASEDSAADALQLCVHRSIDDEYTPGVFETINLMTPENLHRSSGFVQYRPVAYTTRAREVSSSVTAYLHNYNETKIPRDCLVDRYYAKFDRKSILVDEVVASFGQSGDGFYKQSNYTVWTYSVGYGTPPTQSASMFLIIILTIGISTPIVALCCSCFISARIMRNNRESLLREEEA